MKYATCNLLFFTLIFSLALPEARAANHIITATNNQFTPDTMTIASGDTVTWLWENGNHTTTANGIPAGAAPWNALLDSAHNSFTYVATVPGVYNYLSIPGLPSMKGSFTIPGAVTGPDFTFLSPVLFEVLPNVIQDAAVISYELLSETNLHLSLINSAGIRVQYILDGTFQPGKHQVNMNLPESLPAGLYFVAMQTGNSILTRKIMIR